MINKITLISFIFYLVFLSFWLLYPSRISAFPLTLSGSYKNLLTIGETLLLKEDFWSDLNRLRLELDLKPSYSLLFKTVYYHEAFTGTILKKPESVAIKKGVEDNLFDLTGNILDNPDLFWRHSLYRIYLAYSIEDITLTIGRQRIAWGQARIWNPTDLFNPVSPLRIESDQRPGVDALSLEYSSGPLSGLNIVYAPGDEKGKRNAGARLRTNVKGYDLSMIFGEFREDKVIGFDFAGNIGDSGLRGEGIFTDPKVGKDFTRFVISWDYNFPNTLYLLLEYLYNGGNLGRGISLLRIAEFSGEIATRNKNFFTTGIGYDPTPLLRFDLYAFYDMDGRSLFMNPNIKYNLFSNLDWITGVQSFSGDEDSEYGPLPDTYYTSIEWYF